MVRDGKSVACTLLEECLLLGRASLDGYIVYTDVTI